MASRFPGQDEDGHVGVRQAGPPRNTGNLRLVLDCWLPPRRCLVDLHPEAMLRVQGRSGGPEQKSKNRHGGSVCDGVISAMLRESAGIAEKRPEYYGRLTKPMEHLFMTRNDSVD